MKMLGPRDEDDKIYVSLAVSCTSEDQVARVSEALARVATGFALEGLNVNQNITKIEGSVDGS